MDSIPQPDKHLSRICRTCKVEKPLELFQKSLRKPCKACISIVQKRYRKKLKRERPDVVAARRLKSRDSRRVKRATDPEFVAKLRRQSLALYKPIPHRFLITDAGRECVKCRAFKLFAEFPPEKRAPGGHGPRCRACKSEETRKKWHENIQSPEFREKERQRKKSEYEKHHAAKREQANNYCKANPAKIAAYAKKWRQANPKKGTIKAQNRRARKAKLRGTFTLEEWKDLCNEYGNICLKCNQSVPLAADHIISIYTPGATNDISNIQPLCISCNGWKAAKVVDFRPDKSCVLQGVK